MYKMVMAMVLCAGNPMYKTLGQNPNSISIAKNECQPSNTLHTTAGQHCLRCIYMGRQHDFSHMTKTDNQNYV